ncbi:hypothetical protein HYW18_00830 [Candidatus Uhrbacteria bacterium]|nr:hypothetical protein [Candidatus Uhrbacteria bacterium]
MRALISLLFFLSFALPVQAADPAGTCRCWCGSTAGAIEYGVYRPDETECLNLCKSINQRYLGCVAEEDISPLENLRCWSAQECTQTNAATGNPSGIFDDTQPTECMPGFRYCFPYPEPIPLSVHFGDKTFVYGIGGYTATVYRWLIGAAAVFAVIMLMAGGIQYMLAGGSGNVKEAKDRMKNAIIGFVILLSSYLLLLTVNPQTLSLRLPSLPKIRPLIVADGNQSCEAYQNAKYHVEVNGSQFFSGLSCGRKGSVTKGPDGAQLSEETSCFFRACTQASMTAAGETCAIDTTEETGSCMTCADITAGQTATPGVLASPSLCSGLSQLAGGSGSRELCLYVPAAPEEKFPDGYCGSLTLDCNAIEDCEDYGDLVPYNSVVEQVVSTHTAVTIAADLEGLSEKTGREGEPLAGVCTDDPCNLAAEGKRCGVRVTGNDVSCVTNP